MIEFKSILDYTRGTLYNELVDVYSFSNDFKTYWNNIWKEYDDFFYNNKNIAGKNIDYEIKLK